MGMTHKFNYPITFILPSHSDLNAAQNSYFLVYYKMWHNYIVHYVPGTYAMKEKSQEWYEIPSEKNFEYYLRRV